MTVMTNRDAIGVFTKSTIAKLGTMVVNSITLNENMHLKEEYYFFE
jgi:hypothetical protein